MKKTRELINQIHSCILKYLPFFVDCLIIAGSISLAIKKNSVLSGILYFIITTVVNISILLYICDFVEMSTFKSDLNKLMKYIQSRTLEVIPFELIVCMLIYVYIWYT